MISSSSRVIKSHAVVLDVNNKVLIDIPEPFQGNVSQPVSVKNNELNNETNEQVSEEQAESIAIRIINQAKQQAADILTNARLTASNEQDAIISAANEEASKVYNEASERGYAEGINKATAEGNEIIANANQILEDAKTWRKETEESLEPDIIELIIGITDKLVAEAVKTNPETVINLIKQGLSEATIQSDVTVYVSTDDFKLVKEHKDEIRSLIEGSFDLEIHPDPSLKPMDAVISTNIGDTDVSLNGQVEAVKSYIKQILDNR